MHASALTPLHLRSRALLAWLAAALWAVLLAGCVTWVAPFDKDGIARIGELSKAGLAVYQALLDTRLDDRGAAFSGKLAKGWADVQTQARVHLVFEQSREKNDGSITAAKELLGFWEDAQRQYCKAAKLEAAPASAASAASTAADSNVCAGLGAADKTATADFVLKQDRSKLERILGAMVKAEEAKKLAGGASK